MGKFNIEMCCVTDSSTKAYHQFVRENYNRPNCDNLQVKQSECTTVNQNKSNRCCELCLSRETLIR
jgi:hypothetical protein